MKKKSAAQKKKSASSRRPAKKASSSSKQSRSSNSEDIIQLILADHKPLKKLIKSLKGESSYEEKFPDYNEFKPQLLIHAKAEEKAWYVALKDIEDMRADGFEGDTEHAIADRLVQEIDQAEDEDVWMAKVKVLAELVEHHIDEEEEDMLPEYRRQSEAEERQEIGRTYLEFKQQERDLNDQAPREKPESSRKKQESEELSSPN